MHIQGFSQLPASAVVEMIQRDSLCAPELEIFKAVRDWIILHPGLVNISFVFFSLSECAAKVNNFFIPISRSVCVFFSLTIGFSRTMKLN